MKNRNPIQTHEQIGHDYLKNELAWSDMAQNHISKLEILLSERTLQ